MLPGSRPGYWHRLCLLKKIYNCPIVLLDNPQFSAGSFLPLQAVGKDSAGLAGVSNQGPPPWREENKVGASAFPAAPLGQARALLAGTTNKPHPFEESVSRHRRSSGGRQRVPQKMHFSFLAGCLQT